MKETFDLISNWEAPEISGEMKFGDMPGDKVVIAGNLVEKADLIFRELLVQIPELLKTRDNERVVLTVCGGSGVGKSSIASLISYYFDKLGIDCYTLSGDNYPRRIPEYNDAERLSIFRNAGIKAMLKENEYTKERFNELQKLQIEGEDSNPKHVSKYPWLACYQAGGREALKGYLGTDKEQDFEELEKIVSEFKSGKENIWLKRMGRTDIDLWYDEVSFKKAGILLIEWTHGNSDGYQGVDIPILLNSTPQETMAYRVARSRDAGADSPFITMVLEIEQELLESQAHKAKIIVSKQGKLLDFAQYEEYMKEAKGE